MLDRLPPEIFTLVSSFCAQADVVNLAIAYPPCADAILRDIYQCIIIDPVPRKLHGDRATKIALIDNGKPQLCSATTVTTIAGIKRLLATLSDSPEHAKKVRSFSVRGNIAMSDNVLIPRIASVLKLLTAVQEFEWTACPELPPGVVAKLGNTELTSMKVDLAFHADQELPHVRFPYLQSLGVRPFLTKDTLVWLRGMVSECSDLRNLELSRYLDLKSTTGSGFSFLGTSDVDCQNDPVSAVSTFFGRDQDDCHTTFTAPNSLRWSLETLNLIQIDTSISDVVWLAQKADITGLKELRLVGTGRECEHDHQLLRYIIRQRPQLENAELNWNSSILSHLQFLTECCRNVRALKLTIKDQVFPMLEHLVTTCPLLRHLEIDISCDFSLSDISPLREFQEISYLRLPFSPLVNSWEVALQIPFLKVLKLVNSSSTARSGSSVLSSTAPRPPTSMGLLTNGIMGSWNDQLHSPFKCANIVAAVRTNPSLEYVVVDDQVTNLKIQARALDSYRW